MTRARLLRTSFAAVAATALATAGPARPLPERLDAGKNAGGDPCTASLLWERVGSDGLKVQANQPYGLTCRGASAARLQGRVTPNADRGDSGRTCGAARDVAMQGLGTVSARKCSDPLGAVVELTAQHGGRTIFGFATEDTVGPLENVMRALAGVGGDAGKSIDLAQLEAAPMATAAEASPATFSAEATLARGITLIHRGDHVEASRLLNDALSRIGPETPAGTGVELALEAGLADSNISQFESARGHFAAAEARLASGDVAGRGPFLQSKLATYRALDLVNRRQWTQALAALGPETVAQEPLKDPVFLGRLNQPAPGADLRASVGVADAEQRQWLVIEAQRNWARSVALLALGRAGESRAALDASAVYVTELQRGTAPARIAWLRAGLERQAARIAARQAATAPEGERAQLNAQALASADCAIATLQGVLPANAPGCLFTSAASAPGGFGTSGPVVAEAQLERAGYYALKPGVTDAQALKDYSQAVETLAAANDAGGAPPALAGYLDRLIATAKTAPSPEIDEAFFRAMQVIGEPGIARDLARLQDVVAADSALGARVRDREDLEQQIRALRYQITALPAGDPAAADLERQRAAAEASLAQLRAELGDNARFSAVDDSPATIAEVRAALKPGEVYLKVAGLRSRLYGIAIAPDRAVIYPLGLNAAQLTALTERVRKSARSYKTPEGVIRINRFRVDDSYALFSAVAGPAADLLAAAPAVVVDPAGPLRNLPASVLVTSADSVRAFKAATGAARNDYSRVAFLGAKSSLATALSPRSFLVVRSKVPPSAAPQPFLGLGENAPAPAVSAEVAALPVLRGNGCSISYASWANALNSYDPISQREISLAASALGVPGAPRITGAAFSDAAIRADSEAGQLAQYQVLHFATHGVPEENGVIDGCAARNPPALITTMIPPGTGAASDGLLSFSEVARLNLDANLVVLSACDTFASASEQLGRLAGQEDTQPTLDGLVRAFITARARAVLATFWSVPAESETDELIEAFYRTGRTAPIATALREAQLTLIRQPKYSHPYYWGAYFVVGDGSKTMLTGARVAGR